MKNDYLSGKFYWFSGLHILQHLIESRVWQRNQIGKIPKTENGQGRGKVALIPNVRLNLLTCDITNYKRNTDY